MLWHKKFQYQDILTKWLRFQDNFKFQDNFEIKGISGQLEPLLQQSTWYRVMENFGKNYVNLGVKFLTSVILVLFRLQGHGYMSDPRHI